MPRRSRATEPTAPAGAQALAVHVIDPRGVYTKASARAALGLKTNTFGREIRLGRLHAVQRGGKVFILGSWLLRWLREAPPCRRPPEQEPSTPAA